MDNEEKLFLENMKLVTYALNKCKCFYDDDLKQECYLALWKAVKAFDETRGFKFSTFAMRCILNKIYMTWRDRDKKKYQWDYGEEIEKLRDYENYTYLVDLLDGKDVDVQKIIVLLIQGYSQREIKQILGRSQSYVRNRIYKVWRELYNV